jgi:flagellar protein FlgJ
MKIPSGTEYQPPVDPAAKTDSANRNAGSDRLRELCREFEAVFIHTMLKGMRDTVPSGGLLEKGLDGEMMEEMRDLEISKAISRQNQIGIADALYRQLSELEKVEKSDD